MNDASLKITVVGNPLSPEQQALLLQSFIPPAIPGDVLFKKSHAMGEKRIDIELFMASSQEHAGMRKLNYSLTRVFLLVFDAHSPQALEEIKTAWHPEIQQAADHSTPFAVVLVGVYSGKNHVLDTQNSLAFAQENKFDAATICTMDNPRSINAMLDIAVIAGLAVRHDNLTQPCGDYLKAKTLDRKFIDIAITLSQFDSKLLSKDPLKLILLWIARSMKLPRSEENIKDTIELVASNIRQKPRTWSRLTLFKENTHAAPELPLLSPATLTC